MRIMRNILSLGILFVSFQVVALAGGLGNVVDSVTNEGLGIVAKVGIFVLTIGFAIACIQMLSSNPNTRERGKITLVSFLTLGALVLLIDQFGQPVVSKIKEFLTGTWVQNVK